MKFGNLSVLQLEEEDRGGIVLNVLVERLWIIADSFRLMFPDVIYFGRKNVENIIVFPHDSE